MVHSLKQWFPGSEGPLRDSAIGICRARMGEEFVGRTLDCLAADITIVEEMVVRGHDSRHGGETATKRTSAVNPN